MTKNKPRSVAAYLTSQIAFSGVSQVDIAKVLKYDKPNVITMIKQGKTKLPINKVGPMAMAIGADPVHLLRLVMAEYWPDTWKHIQELVGRSLVTERELKVIQLMRVTSGEIDLSLEHPAHRAAFIKTVDEIGFEQFKMAVKRGEPTSKVKRA